MAAMQSLGDRPWIYALWGAAAVAVVVLLALWRSIVTHRRSQTLAALVVARTAELASANRALTERSTTDFLTGLKNRRFLYDHIDDLLPLLRQDPERRAQSAGLAVPTVLLLMVDIDHFKQINDTFGHSAGDRVLQQLSDILVDVTRNTDIVVRWGGEEFLLVARATSRDAGPRFAERIRAAVAAHSFQLTGQRHVRRTCSIGFANYPAFSSDPGRLSWEQVVDLADGCMYTAKRRGRNAWAGVMPMVEGPGGRMDDLLATALGAYPQAGPLRVRTSWVRETDPPRSRRG